MELYIINLLTVSHPHPKQLSPRLKLSPSSPRILISYELKFRGAIPPPRGFLWRGIFQHPRINRRTEKVSFLESKLANISVNFSRLKLTIPHGRKNKKLGKI